MKEIEIPWIIFALLVLHFALTALGAAVDLLQPKRLTIAECAAIHAPTKN